MFYLFEYPLFARCKKGKMGVPAPGESKMSDEQDDIRDRTRQKAYEVEINGVPVHFHGYSMGHALRMAGNLYIGDDDVVTVRYKDE